MFLAPLLKKDFFVKVSTDCAKKAKLFFHLVNGNSILWPKGSFLIFPLKNC